MIKEHREGHWVASKNQTSKTKINCAVIISSSEGFQGLLVSVNNVQYFDRFIAIV